MIRGLNSTPIARNVSPSARQNRRRAGWKNRFPRRQSLEQILGTPIGVVGLACPGHLERLQGEGRITPVDLIEILWETCVDNYDNRPAVLGKNFTIRTIYRHD